MVNMWTSLGKKKNATQPIINVIITDWIEDKEVLWLVSGLTHRSFHLNWSKKEKTH